MTVPFTFARGLVTVALIMRSSPTRIGSDSKVNTVSYLFTTTDPLAVADL